MSTSNKRRRIDHDLHVPDGFRSTKPSSSSRTKPAVQVPQFTSAFDAHEVAPASRTRNALPRAAGSSTRPGAASDPDIKKKDKKLVSMSIQNPQNQFTLEKRPETLKPVSSASTGPNAFKHLPAPALVVPPEKHASTSSLKPLSVPKPPSKAKPALFPAQAPPPPAPKHIPSVDARAPASAFLPKQELEVEQGSSQDADAVFGPAAPARPERERTAALPEFKLASVSGLYSGTSGTSTHSEADRGLQVSPEKRGKGNSSKFIRDGLAARAAQHFASTHTSLVLWHKSVAVSLSSSSTTRSAPLPTADLTAHIVKILHPPLASGNAKNAKSAHVAPGIALCRLMFPASKGKMKARQDDTAQLESRIRADRVYRVVFSFPPMSVTGMGMKQEELFVEGARVRVYYPWTLLVAPPASSKPSESMLRGGDRDGGDMDTDMDTSRADTDVHMHSPTRVPQPRPRPQLRPFPEMPPMSSSPMVPEGEPGVEGGAARKRDVGGGLGGEGGGGGGENGIGDERAEAEAAMPLVGDMTLFCTRFVVMS